MMTFTSAVLLASFLGSGLAGHASVADSVAKPRASTRATPQQAARELEARTERIRPLKNAVATGMMANLLVHFADGRARGDLDRKVVRQLGRSKRSTAQRLATRIRGSRAAARKRVLGSTNTSFDSTVAAADLQPFVHAQTDASALALGKVVVIPPEDFVPPSSYELKLAGIATTSTHSPGTSDTLLGVAFVIQPTSKTYSVKTVPLHGTSSLTAAEGVTTVGKELYAGLNKSVLIVTALVDDAGGEGQAALDEIALLIDLAISVASTLDGQDRAAVLGSMIDYTIAMDDLHSPSGGPARSIVSIPFSPDDWVSLLNTTTSKQGGVSFKIAVPHTVGNGKHDVLLDVPGDSVAMPTVRVSVTRTWLLDTQSWHDDYKNMTYYPDELGVMVRIGYLGQVRWFSPGSLNVVPMLAFERQTNVGVVNIVLTGHVLLRGATRAQYEAACNGDQSTQTCVETAKKYNQHQIFDMDVSPGTPTSRVLKYDTKNDVLLQAGRGVKNKLKTVGNAGRRGGVEVVVKDL